MNIKILFACLLLTSFGFSQVEKNADPLKVGQQVKQRGKDVGSIVFGPYFPISFGKGFVHQGMNLTGGATLSFKFKTFDGIYVGPYFSGFGATVTNQQKTGNYEESVNFTSGAILGYEKHLGKWDASLGLGVGFSKYLNSGIDIGFEDTATALWFNPEISYRFSTYFGAFFSPEIRRDFMNVKVPSEIEGLYNGVNYITLSFGLRINLGSAYKYL